PDPHLHVPLGDAPPREGAPRARRVEPRRPAAPRVHGQLPPQPEDPAPVHPPELRIKGEREARMVGWLEVVSPPPQRIEVPAGELESGQEPERAVRGEVARALGRAQAQGAGAVDRRDRYRESDRRERVAAGAADFEAAADANPT